MNKSKKYLLCFLTLLFTQNSFGFNYFSWPSRQTIYKYGPSIATGLAGTAGLGYYYLTQENKTPWLGAISSGLLGGALLGTALIKYEQIKQAKESEKINRTTKDQKYQLLLNLYRKKAEFSQQKKIKESIPEHPVSKLEPITTYLDQRNKEHLKVLADPNWEIFKYIKDTSGT